MEKLLRQLTMGGLLFGYSFGVLADITIFDNYFMAGTGEFNMNNLRLSGAAAGWKRLQPHEKRGVIKATLDFVYLNIVAFLWHT